MDIFVSYRDRLVPFSSVPNRIDSSRLVPSTEDLLNNFLILCFVFWKFKTGMAE